MKWADYREKLGIGMSDNEKLYALKNKLLVYLTLLENDDHFDYFEEDTLAFCSHIGEYYDDGYDDGLWLVKAIISNAKSITHLISLYIAFYNSYNEEERLVPPTDIINRLTSSLDELQIPFELISDEDGTFIFPKGVSEFDDALVSAPLQWLSAYSDTEKAWSKALREYAKGNSQNASDVADMFRKALETFFKEFFHTDKSLENCKSEYGSYLKQRGVPKELAGNFETLLQSYTNFMNEYAKHREATNDKILEYLMYQTGNIIRLLITL